MTDKTAEIASIIEKHMRAALDEAERLHGNPIHMLNAVLYINKDLVCEGMQVFDTFGTRPHGIAEVARYLVDMLAFPEMRRKIEPGGNKTND